MEPAVVAGHPSRLAPSLMHARLPSICSKLAMSSIWAIPYFLHVWGRKTLVARSSATDLRTGTLAGQGLFFLVRIPPLAGRAGCLRTVLPPLDRAAALFQIATEVEIWTENRVW